MTLQDILAHIDLILLGALALILPVTIGLWFRHSGILHELNEARVREGLVLQRLEAMLREQERVLVHEMAGEREARQAEVHRFQQQQLQRISKLYLALERRFGKMQKEITGDSSALKLELTERFERFQHTLTQTITENRLAQQEGLAKGVEGIGRQLTEGLSRNAGELGKRVEALTDSTDQRLREISGQVEKRLTEGFEKTTETFNRVLEHLTRIDEAQKRITELSSNVVSLQEVLADKRSRGAFGEVQLSALVGNLMPEASFSLQHTLSNGTRVDCMLFLPDPTGNIGIDAKFPLESFRRMTDTELAEGDRNRAAGQFRQDIRKHIGDIAEKYIIPEETSDGAVMFIPAESVFAEIHAHYPDLVEEAYRRRVWLVSPTTMMAILTTARAVLKDAATREQVHIIQQHLNMLSKDFIRFQSRMDKLATHIRQANKDVDEVNISARKISDRFVQIEKVELDEQPQALLETREDNAVDDHSD